MILAAKETNTDRIEFIQKVMQINSLKIKKKAIKPFIESANLAAEINLEIECRS